MAIRNFSVIAAACENFGIGVNNKLPWRLKNEMNYFTRITSSTQDNSKRNVVIMGKNTWLSIPDKYRPLEGRINFVVSRSIKDKPDKLDGLFKDLQSALEAASSSDKVENIFIIGGEQVYRESLNFPECYKIYLTIIDAKFDCDTFFPKFDEQLFKEIDELGVSKEIQEENGLKYTFHVYERQK